jgi:hypothetical protein
MLQLPIVDAIFCSETDSGNVGGWSYHALGDWQRFSAEAAIPLMGMVYLPRPKTSPERSKYAILIATLGTA